MPAPGKSPVPSKVNADLVMAMVVAGAIVLAVFGTFLPSLAALDGPEATWIPLMFYAFAIIDIGIAFYLRSVIKKAQRSSAGGTTVQRQ